MKWIKRHRKLYQANEPGQAQERTEPYFQAVFNAVYEAILVFDYDTNQILNVNQKAIELFGFNREEAHGLELENLIINDVPYSLEKALRWLKLAAGKGTQRVDWQTRDRSGREVWMEVNLRRQQLEQRDCIIVTGRDISERVQAAQQLRQQEARYRSYFEQPVAGIAISSPDQDFMEVNDRLCSLLGYTREELLSKAWKDVTHPDDLNATFQLYNQILSGEQDSYSLDKRYIRKDGELLWANVSTRCVRMASGEVDYLIILVVDITERKQREFEMEALVALSRALRKAEKRAEMLPALMTHVMDMLHAQDASLAMREPLTGDTVYEGAFGEFSPHLGEHLSKDRGISSSVIRSGQPYVTSDIASMTILAFPILDQSLTALACVPLKAMNETIGALMVARKDTFSPWEVRLLTALADMAAITIHRTALLEKSENFIHKVTLAGEIGRMLAETVDLQMIYRRLGEAVLELLPDVSHQFISLFDAEKKQFTCAYGYAEKVLIDPSELPPVPLEPPGKGSQSEAVHTRQPIILNNLRERLKTVSKSMNVGTPEGGPTQSGIYVPMISRGEVIGVVQAQSLKLNRFSPMDAEVLTLVGNTAAVAIQNARLIKDLERSNHELGEAYAVTIEGWSNALDLRDKETEGHSRRVTDLTLQLARKMGLPEEQMESIRWGALLHDIGKMGVPDGILLKPGPLDSDEWLQMKTHPAKAYEMLSPIRYIKDALDIPYAHHEKWNGEGYPRGLKGEAIPLPARIFSVVDVWDAITSTRVYRDALPRSEAYEYIRAQAGRHFDPRVVEVFLEMMEAIG